MPLTATAFYYYDTWILSQAAGLLGKADDARQYAESAAAIRAAFNERFFNAATGQYATGSQCANAIPLVMGLAEPGTTPICPGGHRRGRRARGNALTAGDVGYRYLLRALAEGGRSDVIFDVNNQSEKPGYGYQLRQGRHEPDRGLGRRPRLFSKPLHAGTNHGMVLPRPGRDWLRPRRPRFQKNYHQTGDGRGCHLGQGDLQVNPGGHSLFLDAQ